MTAVLAPDRLPPASLTALRDMLGKAGIALQDGVAAEQKLRDLRQMYEPHVQRSIGFGTCSPRYMTAIL